MTRCIVVHVPKTGGTTLIMNFLDVQRPPPLSEWYRHVAHSGVSNVGDLFRDVSSHEDTPVLLMVRSPIERCESEYSFLRNRLEYRDMIDDFPDGFQEYVQHPQVVNATTKFLLGLPLYSREEVKEREFETLLDVLGRRNVVFGLTEEYENSLRVIENMTDKVFTTAIGKYRTNINKIRRNDWSSAVEAFDTHNEYDNRLYDFIKERFGRQKALITGRKKFSFIGDRYHSLFLYINTPMNRCPLGIYNPKLLFIEKNKKALDIIHNVARERCCGDGKVFCLEWLKLFSNFFGRTTEVDRDDPLNAVEKLATSLAFR